MGGCSLDLNGLHLDGLWWVGCRNDGGGVVISDDHCPRAVSLPVRGGACCTPGPGVGQRQHIPVALPRGVARLDL